jgi:hypothetical protein
MSSVGWSQSAALLLALGSFVHPVVLFLHMLFAVALPLGSEFAELAFVEVWVRVVLVIDVTVTLLLRWKSLLVILAGRFGALERTRMGLFMFRQITFASEDLVTCRIRALHLDDFGNVSFLTACHRSSDIVIKKAASLSLDARCWFVREAGSKRDGLAMLPANKLGHIAGGPKATLEGDLVLGGVCHLVFCLG